MEKTVRKLGANPAAVMEVAMLSLLLWTKTIAVAAEFVLLPSCS